VALCWSHESLRHRKQGNTSFYKLHGIVKMEAVNRGAGEKGLERVAYPKVWRAAMVPLRSRDSWHKHTGHKPRAQHEQERRVSRQSTHQSAYLQQRETGRGGKGDQ